jgi:hypothetical protein
LGSPIPIFSDSVEQFPRGKFCKIGPWKDCPVIL